MKSRFIVSSALVLVGVVVAASGPVATVNAQLSAQASIADYKKRITSLIDKNVTKLQQSAEKLNLSLNVKADKDGISGEATGPLGSASGSVTKDGASGKVEGSNGAKASGSINKNEATGKVESSQGDSITNTVNKDGASSDVKTKNNGNASGSVSKDGATGSVEGSKGTKANGNINKNGANGKIETAKGSGAEIVITKDGVTGDLSVSSELKKKLQDSNKKAIDKLKDLKTKVTATSNLEELKAKAKEFDQEIKDIATANVQASVTKAIDSMTLVLDRLQVVSNNLETRIVKLKDCIAKGTFDGDVTSNTMGTSANVDIKTPSCGELAVSVNSGDNGALLDEKLAQVRSSLQTIRSFLGSSISLVAQLKFGNYGGTMASFKGILSQVDIVASLSAEAKNDLLNLSLAVEK